MSRRLLLVLAGLFAFVAGLVATFPARVALDAFAPGAVRAWGVEGTLWRGKAAAVAVGRAGIGGVEWRLSPWSLLLLRPAADLHVRRPDGFASARVSVSLFGNALRVADLEAAAKLDSLPGTVVPNGTSGDVSARFAELVVRDGWPARAEGRAAVADLKLPGVKFPLGPLEFVFAGDAPVPVAEVRSLGGPLAVEGTLTLPGPGQWSLDALLGPGENPPRELVEGLAYVGEAADGGRRRVQYSGGG